VSETKVDVTPFLKVSLNMDFPIADDLLWGIGLISSNEDGLERSFTIY